MKTKRQTATTKRIATRSANVATQEAALYQLEMDDVVADGATAREYAIEIQRWFARLGRRGTDAPRPDRAATRNPSHECAAANPTAAMGGV